MFFDIHAHAVRRPYKGFPYKWVTGQQLIDYYDSIGVETGALMPLIGPEFYLPQSNEDILDMAAQYPGRFVPFCNVHPQALCNDPQAPLENIYSEYKAAGCKGVGETTFNMSFFNPYMRNLFRAVQKVGLPLTFHLAHRLGGCYGIYDEPGLPGLDETLSNFPKLIMFGHSQTFWAEISTLECVGDRAGYPKGKVTEGAVPKLMRKHKNLIGDLSAGSGANALLRDPEYAVKFLNEFQDQLCFGMDICVAPVRADTDALAKFLIRLRDEGKISETVFNKVAKENAVRILGL